MTPQEPHPHIFGYFPRNKYKDLVFYVKDDFGMNYGLFEMPDSPVNRALMEELSTHGPAPEQQRINAAIKELQHKQANAQGEITHQFLEQDTYREGIIKTCKEAIALLQDGERK